MPKRGSGTAGTNGIWSKKSHLFFPSKRIIPLRTSSKPGKTAACGLDDRTNLSGVSRTQLEESARLAVEGYSDAQTGELRRFNGSNQDYSRPDAANSLIQTEFVAFPDLELADLVRDQRHPNRLRFIIWKKKKAHFKYYFVKKGKLYIPPKVSVSLVRAVRLPTRTGPSMEPRILLETLVDQMARYITLSDEDRWLLAYFVNATWFVDRLKSAPYLWITGPLGSGKSTLLRFLHCVCRRAIVLGDPTRATLYSLPSLLRPTLLIDESDFDNSRLSVDIRRLLRMGSTPGVNACRSGQIFETYCAKVISSRQVPQDAALLSRAIHITMLPTKRRVRPLDANALERIAEEFQPMFLKHRCTNYQNVRGEPPIYVNDRDLTPRMRDHLGSLSGPLLGDPDLVQHLAGVLNRINEEAHLDRSTEPEWLVLEALLALMHDGRRLSSVLAGQIAWLVTNILRLRGETQGMSARGVGSVLKSIGVKTTRVGSYGRGIILTNRHCEEIHAVAHRFELKWANIAEISQAVGITAAPCKICWQFGRTEEIRPTGLP